MHKLVHTHLGQGKDTIPFLPVNIYDFRNNITYTFRPMNTFSKHDKWLLFGKHHSSHLFSTVHSGKRWEREGERGVSKATVCSVCLWKWCTNRAVPNAFCNAKWWTCMNHWTMQYASVRKKGFLVPVQLRDPTNDRDRSLVHMRWRRPISIIFPWQQLKIFDFVISFSKF